MTEENKNYIKLPLLPLRDPELVVFPDLLCEIDVGRPFSVRAINKAKSDGTKLIIAMQNDSTIDHPAAENFYSYCTEVEIKSLLSLDKENTKLRIIVVGMRRGILKIVGEEDGRYWGEMDPIIEPQGQIDDEIIDLIKQTQEMIKDRVQFIVVESGLIPTNYTELSKFVDGIAGQLPISGVKRVTILGTINPKDRLKLVISELAVVANNVEVEVGSSEHTNDEQGSEFTHGFSNEVKELNQRIEKAGIPTDVMKTIKADIRRLSMMSPNNSEFQITYNYLDTLASLPWNKTTEDKLDIVDAEKILNEDHYGLEKVKERILEFLAVRKLKPERKGSILCFFGSPGVGKAQPLGAKVLTPSGFRTMGEIEVGDKVITPTGEISNVIGTFPQGIKDIYKVSFSDDSNTECCKEHLWSVQNRKDRIENCKRTISLENMMEDLYIENNMRKNYSIQTVSPNINFENDNNLPLDPYLVGILISEGSLPKTAISNGDADIIQEVERCLLQVGRHLHKYASSEYDYGITKNHHLQVNNINGDNRSAVTTFLDQSGLRNCLSDTKFIPKEYKLSSASNRERLLQGIMDGDGSSVITSCSVEWSSASIELAKDVMFLVQSLGGQARYSCGESYYTYKGETLQGKNRHRLRITLPTEIMPFLCVRKRSIYENNIDNKRGLPRYIKDVSFVGRKEAKCILIDHPDHLYITDDFIVTHNTSLGKSIARAMGREFIRISLGGTNDEAEIRGHRRTYVGALPGSIIENIRRVKSKNPVFMLDEVDKLCANFRGDPSSALLEVLDPEQNHAFTDHYLNVPFDLSQVFFIGTVNEISPIAPALRDRLEIIEIPGYSPSDKIKIANGHLIPKQKEANGMADKDISLSTQAITKIIEEYTSEAGVRSLERECGTIMRKMAVLVASEKEPPKIIDADMIPKYLGPPKSFTEKAAEKPEIGLSTGLAWSRHGGSLLFIETLLTPGKGKVKLTGNLGKVIQESADAAHTWICASANKLGIPAKMLRQYDVHIHFPSGSVPKEGPSAGVAIAASMLSAFTNRPVRNDIAMTGEITLRGRVLPIGGLKEKILAAHRAGIKQVIFPEKNKHDIEEIPADVVKEMIFTTVSNLEEALDILLLEKTTPVESGDISPGSGEELMNKEVSGTK